MSAEPSDEALMARVAVRDHAAFATLVRRHSRRFYALAYRTLARREEAEDIVQEAFLKLWDKPGSWSPARGAAFTTWFYTLVLNACRDRMKKKSLHPLPEDFDMADDAPDALESLEQRRLQRRLEAAMQALPERQRDALNLCVYEEMSNAEAAEILGVRLKALQSLIMRAKEGLKERMREYA